MVIEMPFEAERDLTAVITGDIVRSSELDPRVRSALPAMLRDMFAEIRRMQPAALPYDIAIFSGDSWQIFLPDPAPALEVAIFMRTRSKEQVAVESRMALAIDHIDFLQPENISESDGPAFQRSGRALSTLDRHEYFKILAPEPIERSDLIQIAADSIADVVDHLASTWTRGQAQAIAQMVAYYPSEPRQQDVARAWRPKPISQPAVHKHLKSAGWELVQRALRRFEMLVQVILSTKEAK